MPRLLMASAMCRMVGEVENTRAERLRVDELQRLLIAPILEEALPVPNDDGMNHEPKLVEEVASTLFDALSDASCETPTAASAYIRESAIAAGTFPFNPKSITPRPQASLQ